MKSERLDKARVNPEMMLLRIERAIANRQRGPTLRSYGIGWGPGGVGCRPVIRNESHPMNPVFGTFSNRHLERGLTNEQWNELKRQVSIFLKIGRQDQ